MRAWSMADSRCHRRTRTAPALCSCEGVCARGQWRTAGVTAALARHRLCAAAKVFARGVRSEMCLLTPRTPATERRLREPIPARGESLARSRAVTLVAHGVAICATTTAHTLTSTACCARQARPHAHSACEPLPKGQGGARKDMDRVGLRHPHASVCATRVLPSTARRQRRNVDAMVFGTTLLAPRPYSESFARGETFTQNCPLPTGHCDGGRAFVGSLLWEPQGTWLSSCPATKVPRHTPTPPCPHTGPRCSGSAWPRLRWQLWPQAPATP